MLNFNRAIRSMSVLALLTPAIGYSDHHEFTIGMLPDTQSYTSLRPQLMEAQINWIRSSRVTENIINVGHLGDLKDRGTCVNATLAWQSLASPDHLTIITSHFLIDCNDSTTGGGSGATASCANTPDNILSTCGANIFDRLRSYPNLFMMTGGHRFGEAYLMARVLMARVDDPATTGVDEGLGLNPVHVVLANYQQLQYSSNFDTVPITGPPNGFRDISS